MKFPSRIHERGIALPMVLGVLVCLLALAVPFSLSMRHQHNAASLRVDRSDVQRETGLLAELARDQVRRSLADVDPTPWWDAASELVVDVDAAAEDLGMGPLEPRSRLWSLEVEELSGRLDLGATPMHVVARVLGMSTTLSRKIDAESQEIRVDDGEALLDSGFVWIDGEVTHYARRAGNVLLDITRPAVVPGVFEPADIAEHGPREIEDGAEVIDFRAYLLAHRGLLDGSSRGFETVEHALSIGSFGFGALKPEEIDRLRRWFSVYRRTDRRDEWVDAQRVHTAIVGGVTRRLQISGGHYYGPYTVLRLRTLNGEQHYALVASSRSGADGTATLALAEPLDFSADAYETIVEARRRAPLNVNVCDPELLARVLVDLPFPAAEQKITPQIAEMVAQELVSARPLNGLPLLDATLDRLVDEDRLERGFRNLLYSNAYHSGDVGFLGTVPFCYEGEGVVDVRAAAALDFAFSGKQRARSFVREIVSVGGGGGSMLRTFATQRDFEESWRLTRRARTWTTFPELLTPFHPSEAFVDPPGRVISENHLDLGRFASEELIDSGARLAPVRLTGFVQENAGGFPTSDVTLHFDSGQLLSDHVDGWQLARGVPPALPVAGRGGGGRAAAANARGSGLEGLVNITSDPAARLLTRAFGVSMYWNPGESLSPAVLFDVAAEEAEDRVLLRFDGQKLIYQVFDGGLPSLGESGGPPPIGTLEYEFDDLPLEADTWYHVTAYCKGNKPSQMALFVDHRARGERHFQSRLRGGLGEGQPTPPSGFGGAQIRVDDAETFPPRGVLKVGGELIEYTSRDDSTFYADREGADPFGGRAARGSHRSPSPLRTHPDTTNVELYGYSATLASDVLPGQSALGSELGMFYVAQLDRRSANEQITLDANGQPFPLGVGWEAGAASFALIGLDDSEQVPEDAFQQNGGYALLLAFGSSATISVGGRTARLDRTTNGSLLGGTEVIYYGGFRNGILENVRRGAALNQDFPPNLAGTTLQEPHAFLSSSGFFPDVDFFPVLVIPISMRLPGYSPTAFPEPERTEEGDASFPEIVQIDLDFDGADEDEPQDVTEWVRFDSVLQGDLLVRDSFQAVRALERWLGTEPTTGEINFSARIFDIAQNPGRYTGDFLRQFFEKINWEQLPDVNPPGDDWPTSSMLAFRGVLGTKVSRHGGGSTVLPVFRTSRRGRAETQVRPGRFDDVTLVDQGGLRKVLATINHAWSQPGPPDIFPWQDGYSHVGLQQSVGARFERTPGLESDGSDDPAEVQVETNVVFQAETRMHSRMLKFPSGELPTQTARQITIGQDSRGLGSNDGMIDEVRIFSSADPDDQLPSAMMLLETELQEQDDDADLHEQSLWFPNQIREGPVIGAFGPLEQLPRDAGVCLIGDEVIVFHRVTGDGSANLVFPEQGRGALGSEAGYHHPMEPVILLPWFVVSRLESSVGVGQAKIDLVDASGFPPQGFVQIDDEVIGYSYNSAPLAVQPTAGTLYVPTYVHSDSDQRLSDDSSAAWRGRYGTRADGHDSDSVVFWLPVRYADTYAADADFPELGALGLNVPARRGWFESLVWEEEAEVLDPRIRLVAQARVQGGGRFDGPPEDDPDLFYFDEPGTETPNGIGRQGDLLQLRFFTEYLDGALDPIGMNTNSWKRAPTLELVAVEYFSEHVVEHHEEREE